MPDIAIDTAPDHNSAPPSAKRVLVAITELHPFVSTGALGTVGAALPPALRALGVDARMLMPGFPAIKSALHNVRPVGQISWHLIDTPISILRGEHPDTGVPVYLVDLPVYYDRPGNPYMKKMGASGNVEWHDNVARFALFSWAAAAFAEGGIDADDAGMGWRPDVVHGFDWHVGLASAYLRAYPPATATRPASVISMQGLRWPGEYKADMFATLNLPAEFLGQQGMGYRGNMSLLKAGLSFADAITTVSESHRLDVMQVPQGFGFESLLHRRRDHFYGILNGVDYDTWAPEHNPHLSVPYGADTLDRRSSNKQALQREFALNENASGFLLGSISRVSWQNGLDLLQGERLAPLLQQGVQVIIHGDGEDHECAAMDALARQHPGQIAYRKRFNEATAQRILGGIDALLMPSRFEAGVGVSHLYAMRFAALPIARGTGSLIDTVIAFAPELSSSSAAYATGFLFDEPTHDALIHAISAAQCIFAQPATWRQLQANAMAERFDWARTARQFRKLYSRISPRPTQPSQAQA